MKLNSKKVVTDLSSVPNPYGCIEMFIDESGQEWVRTGAYEYSLFDGSDYRRITPKLNLKRQ